MSEAKFDGRMVALTLELDAALRAVIVAEREMMKVVDAEGNWGVWGVWGVCVVGDLEYINSFKFMYGDANILLPGIEFDEALTAVINEEQWDAAIAALDYESVTGGKE